MLVHIAVEGFKTIEHHIGKYLVLIEGVHVNTAKPLSDLPLKPVGSSGALDTTLYSTSLSQVLLSSS